MLGNTVFKSDKLTDLTIDVSTAYLIAAPSTPTPVVEQTIERARNGEPMTRAKAIEVWPPRAKTFERPRAISCGENQPEAGSSPSRNSRVPGLRVSPHRASGRAVTDPARPAPREQPVVRRSRLSVSG